MKCPNCKINLTQGVSYDIHEYYYYCTSCLSCSIMSEFVTNKCSFYTLVYNTFMLKGKKNENYTGIYCRNETFQYFGKCLIKVNWIPINVDNISEDLPKLYHKLMKLKAFT